MADSLCAEQVFEVEFSAAEPLIWCTIDRIYS